MRGKWFEVGCEVKPKVRGFLEDSMRVLPEFNRVFEMFLVAAPPL